MDKALQFANLIAKQINHGLTPEEQLELNTLLETDPSNQLVYDEIKAGEAQKTAIDFMHSLSVDAAWSKVSTASEISRSVPVV